MGYLIITCLTVLIFFVAMLYCFYGPVSLPNTDSIAKWWLDHQNMRVVREAEKEAKEREKERLEWESQQKRRQDAFDRLNTLEIAEIERQRVRKVLDRQKWVGMNHSAMDIWERAFRGDEPVTPPLTPTSAQRYGPQRYMERSYNGYKLSEFEPLYPKALPKPQEDLVPRDNWNLLAQGLLSHSEFIEAERLRMGLSKETEISFKDGILTVKQSRTHGSVTIQGDVVEQSRAAVEREQSLTKKLKLAKERWKDEDDVPWRGFRKEWEHAARKKERVWEEVKHPELKLVAKVNEIQDNRWGGFRNEKERLEQNKYRERALAVCQQFELGEITYEKAHRVIDSIAASYGYR